MLAWISTRDMHDVAILTTAAAAGNEAVRTEVVESGLLTMFPRFLQLQNEPVVVAAIWCIIHLAHRWGSLVMLNCDASPQVILWA